MPLFSWIHISDIHVGHGEASYLEDQKLMLGCLQSDIVQQLKNGLPQPDAIMVTGNIAFSGASRLPDEYKRAADWLNAVGASVGLTPDAIFIVPGNHDLQFSADSSLSRKSLLTALRNGGAYLDDALAEGDAREYLESRQANYMRFAADFAPRRAAAKSPIDALHWRHSLLGRDGLRVTLVGLNTALLSADEGIFGRDQGKLRLGMKQLATAFPDPTPDWGELVVVLSHHPFQDGWLADEANVAQWVQSKAHIHLCGHVQAQSSDRLRSGAGSDFLTIVAGAVHADQSDQAQPARHGYNLCSVVSMPDGLMLRVMPRIWSNKNKKFRPDADNLPESAIFAEHKLRRVRPPQVAVAAPPTAGQSVTAAARLSQSSSLYPAISLSSDGDSLPMYDIGGMSALSFESMAMAFRSTMTRLESEELGLLQSYKDRNNFPRLLSGLYCSVLHMAPSLVFGYTHPVFSGNLMEWEATQAVLRVKHFAGLYSEASIMREFPLSGSRAGVSSMAFKTGTTLIRNTMESELKEKGEDRLAAMMAIPIEKPGCPSGTIAILNIDSLEPGIFPDLHRTQALQDRIRQITELLQWVNKLRSKAQPQD